ncbi:dTMP kinase [Ruminiclostridium sufflavum DSM 19573]|uniref:Thymidylate kinase n=1 Tax=Ruminiclostridium sufflavum DSM 19573 TaxID=1121337 RepID=A0A318XQG1_9FIRM|nr:deoxynucleoside kinase [Ruminiclostridium sufflavum]PYG89570.1 dTMP kinase [Ruminiclostridium sufflavum DSM 19573]
MGKENYFINKQKGILIVFEGISGCGKSKGVEGLYRELLGMGFKTKVIEWNSNCVIRKIVKRLHSMNLLTSWIYSILQWISFLIHYFSLVRPSLKQDYILIADRYIYTGRTRDTANGARQDIGKRISKWVRKPDLILFYDVDVQVCYERIERRGKVLFHPNRKVQCNEVLKKENLRYLEAMQCEYLNLFRDPELKRETNIIDIPLVSSDGTRTIIRNTVEEYIKLKSGDNFLTDDKAVSKMSR